MVDGMMYEMITMYVGEYETQARPCAWDDISNPTKVVEYHTTCQDCGQRISIKEHSENSFKMLDGMKITYCTECGSGKKIYDMLPNEHVEHIDSNVDNQKMPSSSMANAMLDGLPEVERVLQYSFDNVLQMSEVNAYLTTIVNDDLEVSDLEVSEPESDLEDDEDKDVKDLLDDLMSS